MSKTNTILAYVFALLSMAAAALLYFETDMKGFPDGYLTELDRAERPLFYSFCFVLMLSGLFLIYLVSFSKWLSRNKIFYKTMLFILVTILVVVGIDEYLTSILENGQGG